MLSGVRLTTSFSKFRKKENNTVLDQVLCQVKKCSSIIWPSNLVNNVSSKCSLLSHKIRETFSVSCEKEHYLYIET